MIVRTKEIPDIYNEIMVDEKKLGYYMDKLKQKAVKKFPKNFSDNYPLVLTEQFKSPWTNNRYLLYSFSLSQSKDTDPTQEYACIFDYKDERYILSIYNQTACVSEKNFETFPILRIFTPHYLKRFRERSMGDKPYSYDEIVAKMLAYNTYEVQINVNEKLVKKYKEYRNTIVMKSKHGMSFVDQTTIGDMTLVGCDDSPLNYPAYIEVRKYRTWVPNEELKGEQWEISHNIMDKQTDELIKGLELYQKNNLPLLTEMENAKMERDRIVSDVARPTQKSGIEAVSEHLKNAMNGVVELPGLPSIQNPVLPSLAPGEEVEMNPELANQLMQWVVKRMK